MGFALLALFGAWAAKCLGSDVPDRNESVNWIVERPIDTDFSEDVPQRAPDTASEAPPMIRVAPGSSMTTLASGLWTASSNTFTDSLYGCDASGSLWVVVGAGGAIHTSVDGTDWIPRASGTGELLLNVNGDGDVWVAVGDGGTVVTSEDGTAWQRRSTPTSGMLRAIAYGGGVYVAGGDNGLLIRSTDNAATWSLVSSGSASGIQGIHYANGLFVAVGADSLLLTSPDGQTWTARTSNANGWLLDCAFGNGTYVAVGLGGRVVTSSDGFNWVRRSVGLPGADNLYRVAYGHGQFVAVGQNGAIWGSEDGIAWWAEPSGTTAFLRGVSPTEAGFVAAGFDGAVLTRDLTVPGEIPVVETIATQPAGSLSDIVVYTSAGHGATGDSATWVFGRGLLHGMVEDIGNIDQLNYFAEYCFKAGATVVPMRPLGHQPNEVVIDNVSTRVTWGGTWRNSTSAVYYGNAGETPYRFAAINTEGTTAWARYRPVIPVSGFYPVYAWTRHGSDRVRQLYRITHSGGETEVRVNHRRVGLGWVWLGNYHFEAGTGGSVLISNYAPGENPASSIVVADAIRFGNGMGDVDRGYGVSGMERELEASRYWVQRMCGQGMSSELYDRPTLNDNNDNVGAPVRMAAEMNRETDGGFWDRIYLGFHSNASGGAPTARGPMGLWDTRGTTLKQERQKAYGTLVANVLHANLQYGQNGVLFPDGYANNSANLYGSGYGELYGTINNEMDSTIIEVAFHDNSADANLMKCPAARRVMGMSSYQAIVKRLAANNSGVGTTLIPAPPTHVAACNDGPGSVTLRWRAPTTNTATPHAATGYTIYRSSNGYGFGNPVSIAGGTTREATLSGLPEGETIYFQICATNGGGESLPSPTVGVRVSPAGFAPHLIVSGFTRNNRTIAPTRYFSNNINGNVTRVIQTKINDGSYVVQHGEAIAGGGRYFDASDRFAVAAGEVDLRQYHAVYWNLGREGSVEKTFTATEQDKVAAFLNGGGRLFVSGSELGWHLDHNGTTQDRNFIHNLLRTAYVADDAGTGTVTASPNGIFAGLGTLTFDYAGNGSIYRAAYPDLLAAAGTPPSAAALVYGASGAGSAVAGLAFAGENKVVTLGFPFETIQSAQQRNALMARALVFFGDAPDDLPAVTIATPDETRLFGNGLITVQGHNNAAVTGEMEWRNSLTGERGSLVAASDWFVAVPLAYGTNVITITGTNYLQTATAADAVVITVTDDTDGDGLPDWWETLHFGGPTAAVAEEDSDGDGLSNLAEYIAGTDPCDASSTFAFQRISATSTNLTFWWPSIAGRIYSLWRSHSPAGPYDAAVRGIYATPPTNTLTLPPEPGESGFYRLQVELPEPEHVR